MIGSYHLSGQEHVLLPQHHQTHTLSLSCAAQHTHELLLAHAGDIHTVDLNTHTHTVKNKRPFRSIDQLPLLNPNSHLARTSKMRSPDCRRPSLIAAPRGKMFLTRMGPGPWTEESLVTTVKPRPSEPRRAGKHTQVKQFFALQTQKISPTVIFSKWLLDVSAAGLKEPDLQTPPSTEHPERDLKLLLRFQHSVADEAPGLSYCKCDNLSVCVALSPLAVPE